MMHLAWRNLFQNKVRLAVSTGGVALALLLILSLDAIFAGAQQRITAYIDNSGADLIVAQEDVRNMHMASSSLPDSVARKARIVPGVAATVPILYLSNMILVGGERHLAYIIGLPEQAEFGGPWSMASGKSRPGRDEAVIDRSVAEGSGVGLGDQVEIMGEDFTIVGLSNETSSLVNSVAFISLRDFEKLRGSFTTFSFLLVQVRPGESPQAVAERLQATIRDVTPQTRVTFAAQEQRVVRDMSTDLLTIMNSIGFLIGLAITALTVYTATLARRAEYGVLMAVGASNLQLYRAVLGQAFFSVLIGFALGLAVTVGITALIPRLGSAMVMHVGAGSLLKVGVLSLVIAGLAAILPIRHIARLDPAMVFRGR